MLSGWGKGSGHIKKGELCGPRSYGGVLRKYIRFCPVSCPLCALGGGSTCKTTQLPTYRYLFTESPLNQTEQKERRKLREPKINYESSGNLLSGGAGSDSSAAATELPGLVRLGG